MIEVYTDGSCLGNPGNGGWAFIIIDSGTKIIKSGHETNTTNNRMELFASICALNELKKNNKEIFIYTDSNYLKKGITEWITKWKKNDWKTSSKQDVKNKDLWIRLDKLNSENKIIWSWVKAHNQNNLNNQVDELARKAANTKKNNI